MAKFNVVGGFERPLSFPDFDTKVLKKRFRKVGKEVAKEARKSVSRKAVSRAWELPGMITGGLRKTITYRVSRSGFSVGIHSYGGKLKEYYPAFVYYGHRAPYTDRVGGEPDKRQRGKKRVGRKVAAPRKNWIVTATERYAREKYQAELRSMLEEAIKPGLIKETLTE